MSVALTLAGASFMSSLGQSIANRYNIKSGGEYKVAQLYNESVPLYQQIGASVREQMMAQANQYMNAGVDVSQGSAFKVVNHTYEQGNMKMKEIRKNLDTQTYNMRRGANIQAQSALISGILSGITQSANIYSNLY